MPNDEPIKSFIMKFMCLILTTILICCISCRKEHVAPQNAGTVNDKMAIKNFSNYPLAKQWATLAFEDNWPSLGDTDMNDLVVNYNYQFGKNENGDIVQVQANFAVTASGASFKNGLGLELPIAPALVKNVTGQRLDAGYIKLNPNGTEAGQTNAVIIPFDNHENLLHYYDYSYFINVYPAKQKITGDTAYIIINFTEPISKTMLDKTPFNPFLISNMRRDYEVHLAGGRPTDKANKSLFNTGDDNSKSGVTYVTKNNFPWALNFVNNQFYYPIEQATITSAYPHYTNWIQSHGKSYADWYYNNQPGYRNDARIFY